MDTPTVLSFSHDEHLLQTRAWILQQAGLRATGVTSWQDFEVAILHCAPYVLLLCQTISDEEGDRAEAFAAEHSPRTRCLVLYTHSRPSAGSFGAMLLPAGEGPHALLGAVFELLPPDGYTA